MCVQIRLSKSAVAAAARQDITLVRLKKMSIVQYSTVLQTNLLYYVAL
jgi:hypothetical protein